MKQMLLAIQFLTIIPVRVKGDVAEKDMVSSTIFFPVAGACQGLIITAAAAVSMRLFSPEVTCGLILLAHIISNGGFDLDGLADAADGLSVKSSGDASRDIEKRLLVMKDSTIGASGAVAIVMSLLLKFLLLKSILSSVPPVLFYLLLFNMAAFSKWITIPAMLHGEAARRDGLGRIFIDNMNAGHLAGSTFVLSILFTASFILQGGRSFADHTGLFVMLAVLLYVCSLSVVKLCKGKFGGMTGDTLGALSEVSEIIYLMAAYIWLRHSTL